MKLYQGWMELLCLEGSAYPAGAFALASGQGYKERGARYGSLFNEIEC